VPEFACAIGKYELTYRGWGTCYQNCSVVDDRDGFTATYQWGQDVVGVLTARANPGA
jgi:3-phenylpropionate/trans-cinnamate dioxygenase ferredoxin reductase component